MSHIFSRFHLCLLVLISRILFLIPNNFFLVSFIQVSCSYFMDAISSQISLKDINLRKFALFCLRSLLSPEFSVAFRVIFLFISSWSFSFPLQVLRMCSNVWPSSFVVYSYLTVMQMNALAFAHSASLCQSCSGYRSQACAVGSFVLG